MSEAHVVREERAVSVAQGAITAKGVEPQGFTPSALGLMSEDEFRVRLELMKLEKQRIRQIVHELLEEGQHADYWQITGTQKKSLLKPGAEKLCGFAGYTEGETRIERDCDYPVDGIPCILYTVHLPLVNREGRVVATGHGSCSSHEVKYRYRRNNDRECPECGTPGLRRGKKSRKFECWASNGGCEKSFPLDDPRIASQPDSVENPDPEDLDNTLLKMAVKRAHIDGTLRAFPGASGFFDDPEAIAAAQDGPDGSPGTVKKAQPAAAPTSDKIHQGQVAVLHGKSKKRAAELGLDEKAAEAILRTACHTAGGGVDKPEDLVVSQLNGVLKEIETFEADSDAPQTNGKKKARDPKSPATKNDVDVLRGIAQARAKWLKQEGAGEKVFGTAMTVCGVTSVEAITVGHLEALAETIELVKEDDLA